MQQGATGVAVFMGDAVRLLTPQAAGDELGISRQRVNKLLERWPDAKVPQGGRNLIDIEKLKALRDANADPMQQLAYQHSARARAAEGEQDTPAPAARKAPAARAEPAPAEEADDDDQGEIDLGSANFNEAKTHRARSDARAAELKVLELEGQLISRREVESLQFAIARRIRDRLRGLPARLQQYVMPEAMQLLIDEVDDVLKQLAEDAAKAVDEAAA